MTAKFSTEIFMIDLSSGYLQVVTQGVGGRMWKDKQNAVSGKEFYRLVVTGVQGLLTKMLEHGCCALEIADYTVLGLFRGFVGLKTSY